MKHGLLSLTFLISITLSGQVKVTYTHGIKGSDSMKLAVYTPNTINPTDSLPVFMRMNSGGFEGGSREDAAERQLCEFVANRSYIGVSVSYRLLQKSTTTGLGCDCDNDDKLHTFREATTDFMDDANYFVNNSKSLQIDTTKIIKQK